MKNKTYHIQTFGCQMNHSDSERISTFLESLGIIPAKTSSEASFVIFNTCGVKQTAENRVYSLIHNLHKNNPDIKIIVTGCISHREDVHKRLKGKVALFSEIKNLENNFSRTFLNHKIERDYLSIIPKNKSTFQAYVPIMTGCNNFCAYCTVPYARGREVSRDTQDILSEISSLIKKGYTHIILLGQNVNSYHGTYTMQHGVKLITFPQLLKKINAIPGKFWISFVSSHPKDMSDELIKTITECRKVCEWVHLPLQAGDDKVIQRMNRKYTQAHYLKLIGKIKQAFKKYKPGISFSITSDIIVGFPGETRKQFMESAKVMEKVKFDMVYFGQFSPRPQTAAWKMKDGISSKEKRRREEFLNEILKKTSFANNKKYKGKVLEVLIEKEKEGFYFGKTRTMKNVKINTDKKALVGKIVKVLIIKTNAWNLEGEIK